MPKKYLPYLFTIIIFSLFTLILPRLLEIPIPCLKNINMNAVAYDECNTPLVLSRYLQISLLAQSLLLILLYIKTLKNKNLKLLIITASVLTSISIISFYNFIPKAEQKVRSADIYLDSLLEK